MTSAMMIVHMKNGKKTDIEVPLDITANQLIDALHEGLHQTQERPSALRTDNPIAYVTGDQPLYEFGFHHGTEVFLIGE